MFIFDYYSCVLCYWTFLWRLWCTHFPICRTKGISDSDNLQLFTLKIIWLQDKSQKKKKQPDWHLWYIFNPRNQLWPKKIPQKNGTTSVWCRIKSGPDPSITLDWRSPGICWQWALLLVSIDTQLGSFDNQHLVVPHRHTCWDFDDIYQSVTWLFCLWDAFCWMSASSIGITTSPKLLQLQHPGNVFTS